MLRVQLESAPRPLMVMFAAVNCPKKVGMQPPMIVMLSSTADEFLRMGEEVQQAVGEVGEVGASADETCGMDIFLMSPVLVRHPACKHEEGGRETELHRHLSQLQVWHQITYDQMGREEGRWIALPLYKHDTYVSPADI